MRYFYIWIVALLCSIFKIKRRELKWEDYFGDWKEPPYISPLPKMSYDERERNHGYASGTRNTRNKVKEDIK